MSEKTEILALTEDMTEKLPEEVQESVVWLSKEIRPSELVTLNPVVIELLEVKELAKIIYDPEKEDETVQQYKDAKKKIGAFNTSVRAAKKTMKGSYDAIGKKIIVLEKGILAEAAEVLETLQTSFKPYLDAEQKKKDDREAEKERIQNEKVNKLKEENAIQAAAIKKQNLINTIKYEIIVEEKTKAISQLNKLNLDMVKQMRKAYAGADFQSTVMLNPLAKDNYHLLDEKDIESLTMTLNGSLLEIEDAYKNREEELQKNENLRLSSEREKGQLEGTQVIVPNPPAEQPKAQENPYAITKEDLSVIENNTGPVSPVNRIQNLLNEIESVRLNAVNQQEKMASQSPHHEKLASQIADMMKQAHDYVTSKL